MHPKIAEFPSKTFYDGKLLNGISERDRTLPPLPWPNPKVPCMFIHVSSQEMVSVHNSKSNPKEVEVLIDVLRNLQIEKGFEWKDVGILSAYSAQVKLIRKSLRSVNLLDPYLTIQTIDGFQGREKEIIIFSTVRSNKQKKVSAKKTLNYLFFSC